VDPTTGNVHVTFTPAAHHIGFEGIIHGGAIATVVDEAMVWAATWAGKRFCVCGEMTVRFRQNSRVGKTLRVEARIEGSRSRLIQTVCDVLDESGQVYATASGKYVPVSAEHHQDVVKTFVREPSTSAAAEALSA
jgi:acyl-coenzyme A thioesterase PaaI-like protein